MSQTMSLTQLLPTRRKTQAGAAQATAVPTTVLVIIYLVIVVAYPMARLVEAAVRRLDGAWTLQYAADVLTAPGLVAATRNSLVVAISVTLVATILGGSLAWLVGRTDVPGRRYLKGALLLPFVIPPFVGAIAWLQLLGGAGWINQLARNLPFVGDTLWNVRGAGGIIFVLILTSYPLAYVTILGSLNRLDPALEESSRISGAHLAHTLWAVTLPVMRPAVASGAVLVFIYSMANFGVPAVLGFTEGFFVLPTRIFDLIARSARPGSLNQAAALSVLLGLIALGSLLLQRLGSKRAELRLSQKAAPDVPLRLGRWRAPAGWFAWSVVVIAGVLPLAAITLGAFTSTLGRLPMPANLSAEHFVVALTESPTTLRAIRNSFMLAFGAGIIITFLGAVIAYLSRRTTVPGRNVVDAVATFPYALPGTVVAVAVLLAFIRPLGPIELFNTLWIILLAYLVHYLAYGVRTTSGALAMMDRSMEEASRICGASASRTFWRIVVPMLRPALFAGFFLVFIPTLRELTISVLLWGPGTETIGVVVFNLQVAGETQAAAAVAVLMLLVAALANFVTRRVSGGRLGY